MENENTKWKELSIFSKGNNEDMHFEITLQEIDSFIGHDKTEEGWLLLKSLLSEKTIRSSVKLLDIIGKFLEKDIQEEKKEVYTLLLK